MKPTISKPRTSARLIGAVLLLAASAFGQNLSADNVGTMCKNEGDPDCMTVIGYTMFKVELPETLKITDGFREIASIDPKGNVKIVDGVTPEYVISMMAKYWLEQSKGASEQHQAELNACMDGWKHTLTVLKIALKPKAEAKR